MIVKSELFHGSVHDSYMLLPSFKIIPHFMIHVPHSSEARNHSSFITQHFLCRMYNKEQNFSDPFFVTLQNLQGTVLWVITPASLTAFPVQLSIWAGAPPFRYMAAINVFHHWLAATFVICNPASSRIPHWWGRPLPSQATVRWPPRLIPTPASFRSWQRKTSEVILVKLATNPPWPITTLSRVPETSEAGPF